MAFPHSDLAAPASQSEPAAQSEPGAPTAATESPERRGILDLVGATILSVAELSAHLHLPVGVVRVLVADLTGDGLVVVHTATPPANQTPAANLKVLESVLDGISSL